MSQRTFIAEVHQSSSIQTQTQFVKLSRHEGVVRARSCMYMYFRLFRMLILPRDVNFSAMVKSSTPQSSSSLFTMPWSCFLIGTETEVTHID